MKLLASTSLLFLTLFSSANLLAETNLNKEALTIRSVEVTPIETNYIELNDSPVMSAGPLDEISIILDGLLAIGKKVWPIIQAGKPVIDAKLAPAVSIIPHMPEGTDLLLTMGNWSMPKAQSIRVSYKNGFGAEVIGFKYTVLFQYAGNYKGIGSYVTNLKIVASEISVAWGFEFDASSELLGISNVGSTEFPVASGMISVNYSAKSIISEMRHANTIYVDGNGNIKLMD